MLQSKHKNVKDVFTA